MPDTAYAHIMIDCETLGTRPGCHILSLAAIGFAPATGVMDPEPFEARIGLPPGGDLTVDADTLRWWLRQSDDARALALIHRPEFPALRGRHWMPIGNNGVPSTIERR